MKIKNVAGKSVVGRVLAILNALPNDEVITTFELAENLGSPTMAANLNRYKHALTPYCQIILLPNKRQGMVWGNKQAITALRRQIEKGTTNEG